MAPEVMDHDLSSPPSSAWLTRIAFGGALVLVIARALLTQYLREDLPAPLPPGAALPARAAGPAVAVVLDSFALVLALLVVLRAAISRNWRLQRTWSVIPLLMLAIWSFASTSWASDRFAAAVSGSGWLAAAALVFVFAQTVRTWSRLRIVAGVAAGLFLANVAYGIIYRFIDLPPLIEEFQQNKLAYFEQRGWAPDSFAAQNFEHRVMAGQTGGFASSPNSFAATLVMLGFVTVGLVWQRLRERSEPGWAAVLAITLLPAIYVLWTTGSRTALGAAMLIAAVLVVGFWKRDLLMRNRWALFAGIAALMALGIAGVVGIGLATGTLPHPSLAFRWNYWQGAWGVFLEQPARGVGFANFGDAYLAHRLPVAAEEVKDPHNVLVRFFSETGLVGGALVIAWLLGFIWSQTSRVLRPDDQQQTWPGPSMSLKALLGIVVAGIVLHSAAAIDFTTDPYYVFLELIRRGLYALLMLGALLLGTIRSSENAVVDTTPAHALLAAMVAGLAAALVHAMADVVIFEPTVLASFAMLMGAVIGIRATDAPVERGRAVIWPLAVAGAISAAAFVAFFTVPLVISERYAAGGDDLIRRNRPSPAVSLYESAALRSPVSNSSYHHRTALAAAYAQRPVEQSETALKRAIAANPRGVAERVALAGLYMRAFPEPRLAGAAEVYAQIVELNPNDLDLRLQYADVLERLGRLTETADQLELVLQYNSGLTPEEPERLTTLEVEQIKTRVTILRGNN